MGLFSYISRRVEIRKKSRFQPVLFYSRAIYRPVSQQMFLRLVQCQPSRRRCRRRRSRLFCLFLHGSDFPHMDARRAITYFVFVLQSTGKKEETKH